MLQAPPQLPQGGNGESRSTPTHTKSVFLAGEGGLKSPGWEGLGVSTGRLTKGSGGVMGETASQGGSVKAVPVRLARYLKQVEKLTRVKLIYGGKKEKFGGLKQSSGHWKMSPSFFFFFKF